MFIGETFAFYVGCW